MKSSRNGGGGTAQHARRALAVLLGLLCGLALAELAFRVRDHGAFPHLNVYLSDPAYGVRLRPGATTQIAFGGAQVSSVFIHSGGFRGSTAGAEPPPAKGEVLFVGDSQTFGLGVEASQAFPARFAQLAQLPAYNAGVPTWGPPEFLRALKELGQRRHPATIVYVVNFANDPFEAERPNAERHVVWDGWAVRRETAPAHVSQFPGRELLFARSHLVFAFRQWWYRRSAAPAQDSERGNPSEGTFRDLFALGQSFSNEQVAARQETERRAQLYESQTTYAEEGYRLAESKVRALVWEQLKLGSGYAGIDPGAPGSVYLAADANPGDIVLPGVGEEGRALYATALYIRQAVELRNRFEAELARRASSALGQEEAKQVLAALSARDQERLKLAAVRAQPLELVRATSPLTRKVLQAKQEAEALGARFVLLVLPIDVMVSNAEWPKHGKSKVDLAPARVLIQDLVESVREAGGVALDASAALAAAEPGAFLPTDIHLTPKGHDAVARALLRAVQESTPSADAPRLVLEPGRSRVPPPEAWDALGGETAVTGSGGCPITKKYREWLYVRCYPENAKAPRAVGLQVMSGGLGDAITWLRDGSMTLVAPIPSGTKLDALFSWSDGTSKRLRVTWDAAGSAPDMTMTPENGTSATAPGDALAADRVCACYQSVHPGGACSALIANADATCVATYADDCARMLACAQGDALYPPHCPSGLVNRGASLHCGEGSAEHASTLEPPAGLASSDPTAPGPAATSAQLGSAASALMNAAQAFIGPHCVLGADSVELIAVVPFDRCPSDQTMLDSYQQARATFDAAAPQLTGAGATFRDKARSFGEFVKAALDRGDTRGSAAFYQDLALAHNLWRPEAAVAVDPPRIVALYFGVSGVPHTDYFRNLRHDGAQRKAVFEASHKHFIWRRGPNGFEGPYLEGDSRIIGGYPDD
jgi:hypothetical protein